MRRFYGQTVGLVVAAAGIAGLAYGCESFSADAADDAGADAADAADAAGEIADSGSNADASTDSGAANACVPRSIAEDAGPPDASCDGVGVTDLRSSDGHCGVCRHSCLGEGCESGQCHVAELTPLAFVANQPPGVGALADGAIYLAHAGIVYRLALAGGPLDTVFSALSDGGTGLTPPFVARGLGWTIIDQAQLVSFPLDGSPSPMVEATGNIGPTATDGKAVYYADANGGHVYEVGSTSAIYTDANVASIYVMAADGDGVYFMVGLLGKGAARAQLLLRSPSGNVRQVLDSVVQPTRMVLDGAYLYWSDVGGAVWRLDKTKPMAAAEPVMQLPPFPPSATSYVKGLVVDAENVYVAATEDGNGGSIQASFFVGQKCGGPARLLRSDFFYGGILAADQSHLYWTRSDGIERMAK